MIFLKIFLAIIGGIVLAGLFFMSSAPLKEFFHPHASFSIVHFSFGLALLIVLFWVGFFATWITYSLIIWSADTVLYNMRNPGGGGEQEGQKTVVPEASLAETTPISEDQGIPAEEHLQADGEAPTGSSEDESGVQDSVESEKQAQETMLTREEFAGLIKASGMTKSQAADKLGVSRQMVSYVIHGKRDMTKRISQKARSVLRNNS
jgi:hypothetical protein